jgi:hypothetical protein
MREDERTRKLADGSFQGNVISPVKPVELARGSSLPEIPTKAELLEAYERGAREGVNAALREELASVRHALRSVMAIIDGEGNAYRKPREQETIKSARRHL